jgi:hypothetical protein
MGVSRAQQAHIADRRAKLIKYRLAGRAYEDIYQELGYASRTAASKDFSRALEQNIAEERTSMEVYRETEILRLDGELERLTRLYAKVERILDKFHVTVQFGKVVTHDGEPLEDDGPVLAAVDRLVKIEDARRRNGERRSKLLGLDAAQRVSMEVVTLDALDAERQRLVDLLAANDREAATAGGDPGATS